MTRHFEEDVLNEVADRTAANPLMMQRRKGMVEHPFGTLKRRMDGGRFLVRGIQKVKTEMASGFLHSLNIAGFFVRDDSVSCGPGYDMAPAVGHFALGIIDAPT